MKDDDMLGQMPMQQFQSPDGDWSVVALLIAACGSMVGAILYLFRSREAENKARIDDLKIETEDLRKDYGLLRVESNKCQEDRILLHGQMTELKLQMLRLTNSK